MSQESLTVSDDAEVLFIPTSDAASGWTVFLTVSHRVKVWMLAEWISEVVIRKARMISIDLQETPSSKVTYVIMTSFSSNRLGGGRIDSKIEPVGTCPDKQIGDQNLWAAVPRPALTSVF